MWTRGLFLAARESSRRWQAAPAAQRSPESLVAVLHPALANLSLVLIFDKWLWKRLFL